MSALPYPDSHGLVRPWERNRSFHLHSVAPTTRLEHIVDRHWIVEWDLRGCQPFQQEILPHPSVNLVLEPQGAWVWGVPTQRDVRLLQGEGWAVGTKFKPGAFTAVTGLPAGSITDGRVSIQAAFGGALDTSHANHAADRLGSVVKEIEVLLAPVAGRADPALELITQVVETMGRVPAATRVEEIAAMHHMAPRTLQRLFRRYIGVSPKWVLKRLRIHQATEHLAGPNALHWTDLALELGYYDHPHSSAISASLSGARPPNTPPKPRSQPASCVDPRSDRAGWCSRELSNRAQRVQRRHPNRRRPPRRLALTLLNAEPRPGGARAPPAQRPTTRSPTARGGKRSS